VASNIAGKHLGDLEGCRARMGKDGRERKNSRFYLGSGDMALQAVWHADDKLAVSNLCHHPPDLRTLVQALRQITWNASEESKALLSGFRSPSFRYTCHPAAISARNAF